jgi:hypothetical protein
MTQPNTTHDIDAERALEVAAARADLQRRAEAQGIKPFDADEWSVGLDAEQTPEEIRREVDDFLVLLRAARDTTTTRSIA